MRRGGPLWTPEQFVHNLENAALIPGSPNALQRLGVGFILFYFFFPNACEACFCLQAVFRFAEV